MTKDKIRVAGVGAGYFSQFHYDSWQRMEHAELVAVCDLDADRARSSGAPRTYADISEMLNSEEPNLLDIVLPPTEHAAAIRAALGAGMRWIVCQKPFCRDLDEARAVTEEAEHSEATLIVHENFRFQPWYRAIKDALEADLIGTVLQATFRLRPGDGQGPDAYLDRQPYFQQMQRFLVHETAVHWIDTFRFLFGTPIAVYADLRRINPAIAGEDAGLVIFDHTGGVRAVFDGNRHLDHAADNLRRTMGEALIEGTKGSLRLDGSGAVSFRPFGSMDTQELLASDDWEGFGGDCVHALQSHVIHAVRTGKTPENLARDYLAVIEVEAAIYTSAETGKKIKL